MNTMLTIEFLTDDDEGMQKTSEGEEKMFDFSNVNTTCAKHLTDFPPTHFFFLFHSSAILLSSGVKYMQRLGLCKKGKFLHGRRGNMSSW